LRQQRPSTLLQQFVQRPTFFVSGDRVSNITSAGFMIELDQGPMSAWDVRACPVGLLNVALTALV
jgi:hypothetical protein